MSNNRRKRRFYPEFYTEEELESMRGGNEPQYENTAKVTDISEYITNTEESQEPEQHGEVVSADEINEPVISYDFPDIPITENTEKPGDDYMPEDSRINSKKFEALNYNNNLDNLSEFDYTEYFNGSENNADNDNIDEPENSEEPEPAIPTFAEKYTTNHDEPEIHQHGIREENPPYSDTAAPEYAPPQGGGDATLLSVFDREGAIKYARLWALDRNPDYYNYEDLGGDCTNYISQILLAGGCKMDTSSLTYGWYYNTPNDKSPSWTGVEPLYNYLVKEKDFGTYAIEIEPEMIQAGDIAQLSFNGKTFQHTPFIVSVERGPDGAVSFDNVKICAHSFDSHDRPLNTYQWRKIRFIRILGHKGE